MSDSFATLWTEACQVPLSMEFGNEGDIILEFQISFALENFACLLAHTSHSVCTKVHNQLINILQVVYI